MHQKTSYVRTSLTPVALVYSAPCCHIFQVQHSSSAKANRHAVLEPILHLHNMPLCFKFYGWLLPSRNQVCLSVCLCWDSNLDQNVSLRLAGKHNMPIPSSFRLPLLLWPLPVKILIHFRHSSINRSVLYLTLPLSHSPPAIYWTSVFGHPAISVWQDFVHRLFSSLFNTMKLLWFAPSLYYILFFNSLWCRQILHVCLQDPTYISRNDKIFYDCVKLFFLIHESYLQYQFTTIAHSRRGPIRTGHVLI